MKKILLVLFLGVCCFTLHGQTLLETVYLKNGSVIKGVIIEHIPSVSLKIQTADGSLFVCQMSDIEKITKDVSYPKRNKERNYLKKYDGLKKGYRGFFDFGGTIGVGEYGEGRIEFSTSHGFQASPYFFIGGGLGLQYLFYSGIMDVPLYAQFRSEFLNNRISPFVDFKIGYCVYNDQGIYINPSIGCRLGFGNKGLSVSLGYMFNRFDNDVVYYHYNSGYYSGGSGYYYYDTEKETCGGVTLKLSFDF